MKKIIYILTMMALMVLSSCYDSTDSWEDRMRPTLTTYSATITANKVVFHGESNIKSPILFFEISPSEKFEEKETRKVYASYNNDSVPNVYAELSGLIQPGTQYVRLCSQVSDDGEVIYAENIEEMHIDNPIKTLEVRDITEKSVVLSGLYEGSSQYYPNNKYFEISTDPNFTDKIILNDFNNHFIEDGNVVYECVADNLDPSTEYYVRFCCFDNDIFYRTDVKGNTVKFTTEKGVVLEFGKITCPNPSYNLMLIVNPQGTFEYTKVYLKYDKDKDSYVPISNNKIILLPNVKYNTYVFNSTYDGVDELVLSENSRPYATLVDNGGWRIFYAKSIVDYNSPVVSLEAKELTCEVTFEFYSFGSGNYGFELKSDNYIFPHYFYIDEGEFFHNEKFWFSMIFVNRKPLYMIPFEAKADDNVKIMVNPPEKYYEFNMSPVKMVSGEKYHFINGKLESDKSELGASDVIVDTWEETEGGNITITPKK